MAPTGALLIHNKIPYLANSFYVIYNKNFIHLFLFLFFYLFLEVKLPNSYHLSINAWPFFGAEIHQKKRTLFLAVQFKILSPIYPLNLRIGSQMFCCPSLQDSDIVKQIGTPGDRKYPAIFVRSCLLLTTEYLCFTDMLQLKFIEHFFKSVFLLLLGYFLIIQRDPLAVRSDQSDNHIKRSRFPSTIKTDPTTPQSLFAPLVPIHLWQRYDS